MTDPQTTHQSMEYSIAASIDLPIRVTWRHIAIGRQDHSFACPVAMAIEDAGGLHPCVDYDCIGVHIGNALFSCRTPTHLREWMEAFDNGVSNEPQTSIRPVAAVLPLQGIAVEDERTDCE